MHLKQYLTQCQMEQAKALLFNTEDSIQSIAYACGYSDAHNFARAVRQELGMSPSEARKRFRQK